MPSPIEANNNNTMDTIDNKTSSPPPPHPPRSSIKRKRSSDDNDQDNDDDDGHGHDSLVVKSQQQQQQQPQESQTKQRHQPPLPFEGDDAEAQMANIVAAVQVKAGLPPDHRPPLVPPQSRSRDEGAQSNNDDDLNEGKIPTNMDSSREEGGNDNVSRGNDDKGSDNEEGGASKGGRDQDPDVGGESDDKSTNDHDGDVSNINKAPVEQTTGNEAKHDDGDDEPQPQQQQKQQPTILPQAIQTLLQNMQNQITTLQSEMKLQQEQQSQTLQQHQQQSQALQEQNQQQSQTLQQTQQQLQQLEQTIQQKEALQNENASTQKGLIQNMHHQITTLKNDVQHLDKKCRFLERKCTTLERAENRAVALVKAMEREREELRQGSREKGEGEDNGKGGQDDDNGEEEEEEEMLSDDDDNSDNGKNNNSNSTKKPKSKRSRPRQGQTAHDFEEMFQKLKTFQQQHGTCFIPFHYEDATFRSWVANWRNRKKVFERMVEEDGGEEVVFAGMDDKDGSTDDGEYDYDWEDRQLRKLQGGFPRRRRRFLLQTRHRIQRLDSIGFEWTSYPRVPFEERLVQMMQFMNENGHFNVHRSHEELGEWFHKVKQKYKEGNKGFFELQYPKLMEIGVDLSQLGLGWR